MRKRNIAIIVIALMQSPATLARPVSYPGGWTVMQMHNRANTSVHLHYSPSARHSVGVRGFHIRDKNAFAGALQVNVLLKRVNNRESQANLYFKGGGGAAWDNDDISFTGFSGLAADWETRRLFIRYENRVGTIGGRENSFRQSARAGLAPYVADFGSLHTWLMLEVSHYPSTDYEDKTEITPLARFFKGDSLFEIGWSFNGKLTLNFIRRF
ncbi:MAG: hypothetical protein GKS04_02045 [Candidatus Mycalebacterium zealandia]|nr:MAG: hypothetical protein GKS04_02045 [Candidatus Mycalebacterium zealandia]